MLEAMPTINIIDVAEALAEQAISSCPPLALCNTLYTGIPIMGTAVYLCLDLLGLLLLV